MRTCPVCGAQAFDDAQVCYGCLHRFTSDGSTVSTDLRESCPLRAPVRGGQEEDVDLSELEEPKSPHPAWAGSLGEPPSRQMLMVPAQTVVPGAGSSLQMASPATLIIQLQLQPMAPSAAPAPLAGA